MSLGLDFETFSDVDLKKVGLDNYINSPLFTPLLASVAYRSGGGYLATSINLVEGSDAKWSLHAHIMGVGELTAFNAGFERRVLKKLYPQNFFDVTDAATMARCAGAGNRLEQAAPQLLDTGKLESGAALIKKFCVGAEPPPPEIIHDPDWQEFRQYCEQDAILALRIRTLYPDNRETRLELITDKMNEAGWFVDRDAVQLMQERMKQNQADALHLFRQRFDPKAELNFNSSPQLKKWCKERKILSNSFDEAHVERMITLIERKINLGLDTPDMLAVYEMLKTKQVLGGSALKKLPTIMALTNTEDSRLRNQYIHCGAGQSHRTSGVGVQMQNLKRLSDPLDMSTLDQTSVEEEWTNEQLANNMRQLFKAEHPDGALIVGDFASVESRGLAWLAGEQWKTDAYFDGKDMYKMMAVKFYGILYEDVDKAQRTFGKVGELSCGYGAGSGAVKDFAKKMHVEMTTAQAQATVNDWRQANPKIVAFWAALDNLLKNAMSQINKSCTLALHNGYSLYIYPTATLPSLEKEHPGAVDLLIELVDDLGRRVMSRYFRGVYRRGGGLCYHKPSKNKTGKLWTDQGMNPKTKQMSYYTIYGGKLAGILTQSFCREIFFDVLTSVNSWVGPTRGLKLIGQFHDEIVLEWSPDCPYSLTEVEDELRQRMSSTRHPGFPLSAEVHSDHRYIK